MRSTFASVRTSVLAKLPMLRLLRAELSRRRSPVEFRESADGAAAADVEEPAAEAGEAVEAAGCLEARRFESLITSTSA